MALSPLSQPKLKQGMVVVKEIRAEAEGGIIGTLQKLFPDVFTSDTKMLMLNLLSHILPPFNEELSCNCGMSCCG
eukprot:198718-Pelagomonas_calceolata.AAC.3